LSVSVIAGATVIESPVCTPHRVEVLDRADDDDVVLQVAHHFQLVLFPAEHGFLDQDLVRRAGVEARLDDLLEFLAVVGDPAAGAAERERGPDDRGKADRIEQGEGFVERRDRAALGRVEADPRHRLLERLPVLGDVDRGEVGPDQLDPVLFEDAALAQGHGQD
jgi:hypothetical protein